MSSAMKTVFIYGTLKRGQCRSDVMSGQQFIGEARTTSEYQMYNHGYFPCLVENGKNSIVGELWEISDECKDRLDQIEGAPYLYDLLPIKLETHPGLECYSYLYQQNTVGLADCGVCW